MRSRVLAKAVAGLGALALLATACGGSGGTPAAGAANCKPSKEPTINLAAYSTAGPAYGAIIPLFQTQWHKSHPGQTVQFLQSYQASGTQSEAVVNGFPADVVALSLAPDVDRLKEAGLITDDWTAGPGNGFVTNSVVAFEVRHGNPKNIHDYRDLAEPGVKVLTADPASSGSAKWNLLGIYGSEAVAGTDGAAGGAKLLEGVLHNVVAFDKSGRDSLENFESGNGDVAINYENEILSAETDPQNTNQIVYPSSSILIQNPVAVVDANAKAHCVEDVANAFVKFLHTPKAQKAYEDSGYLRGQDPREAMAGDHGKFPPMSNVWTIDRLGGWSKADTQIFGDNGVYQKAFQAARG
jgi:sulfate transport system substrate-binding protein